MSGHDPIYLNNAKKPVPSVKTYPSSVYQPIWYNYRTNIHLTQSSQQIATFSCGLRTYERGGKNGRSW